MKKIAGVGGMMFGGMIVVVAAVVALAAVQAVQAVPVSREAVRDGGTTDFYASVTGIDSNNGSRLFPFKTLQRAQVRTT